MGLPRTRNVEFGSARARDLLAARGLTDLDAVLQFEGEPLGCRHPFKTICTAVLQDGDREVRVYIKKQWQRSRLIPRWPDLRHGKAFWTWPECEWRGLWRFRRIGLDTAEPLALLANSWLSCRSAVITRAVPCDRSLHQLIEDGTVAALPPTARSTLIDAVVSVIERIHAARLAWRSMKTKHFYPVLQGDGTWRIWLIDCEGVHGRVTSHYVRRNRADFIATLRVAGADEEFVGRLEGRLTHTFNKTGNSTAGFTPATPYSDRRAFRGRSGAPRSRAAGRGAG